MRTSFSPATFLFVLMAFFSSYSYGLQTKFSSPSLHLGDGYLSYNKMAVGESALNLADTKVKFSSLQSSIFLTQTIDHFALAKMLNVDVTANGGWGLFATTASANYLSYTEDTQYKENFTFMERYYTNALLDITNLPANLSALTDQARELYHKDNVKQFTYRYGDTFVSELPIGAMLVVNVQLNFATTLDKEKFDETIQGKLTDIFNASVHIGEAVNQSHVKGYLEVSAYQLGGNPEALPNILTKKADNDYYFTTCSLDNLKDCRNVINGIVNYAQSDFRKQITYSPSGEQPKGNFAVVGEPLLTTYTSKFNLMPAPKLHEDIVKNRLELASLFHKVNTNKMFFDHYMASPVAAYFSAPAFKLTKEIQSNLTWNLDLIRSDGPLCYISGDEGRCPQVIKSMQDNMKAIDETIMNFYLDTGFQELAPNCSFIPVGTPQDENLNYAAYCSGKWIKGLFTFKLLNNKQNLQINGDYIAPNGTHTLSKGLLTADESQHLYSGVALFEHLDIWHCKQKKQISMRVSRNFV